jgi:hypothetical protein
MSPEDIAHKNKTQAERYQDRQKRDEMRRAEDKPYTQNDPRLIGDGKYGGMLMTVNPDRKKNLSELSAKLDLKKALGSKPKKAAIGGSVRKQPASFAPKRAPRPGELELEESKAKLKILKKTGKMPTGHLPRRPDPNRY